MSTMVYTMSEHRTTSSVSLSKHFSPNSNTAGGPLPLIPRRVPSASRPPTTPTPASAPSTPKAIWSSPTVVEPTPPDYRSEITPPSLDTSAVDSESGSSSNVSDDARPKSTLKTRRVRGQRVPSVRAPENSTPTPAVFEAISEPHNRRHLPLDGLAEPDALVIADTSEVVTPRPSHAIQSRSKRPPAGSLRLNITTTKARHYSESHHDVRPTVTAEAPIQIPPSAEARLVRKKSGQPVKSSLKSTKIPVRGSISIITRGSSSKSEPNTPTHSKAVHFDSQLEHVKLFLAEQKPLAVSRDGSPTDDTSGTDTDFPSFIYGGGDDDKPRKALLMKMNNMPQFIDTNADVALENLILSTDMACILGHIRVRNLAFHKWVAVRFTFDNWQTTSEVAAKHFDSIESGAFDRFSFSIRLTDLLARIEEKTLLLAVRYSIEGREMWDNNRGLNYNATFIKSKKQERPALAKSDDESAGSDIADLTSKLEKVALGRGSSIHQTQTRTVFPPPDQEKPPMLKEGVSLASRYDFGTSSRSPWKPISVPVPPTNNRTISYPPIPTSVPWPQKPPLAVKTGKASLLKSKEDGGTLGSPRDLDDSQLRAVTHIASDPEDLPFPVPPRAARNHQRGYFDSPMSEAPSVRRTPPGTPLVTSFDDNEIKPQRLFPFPPIDNSKLTPEFGSRLDLFSFGGSEESTPSTMSPANSSRSSSPSPSPSPTGIFMARLSSQADYISPAVDYTQFLNK
jgi:hypothetical protein